MQALKGVVFLMTLAIAVLMTLIVYGMYQKSQDPDFKFIDLGGSDDPAKVESTQQTVPSVTPSAPLALPPGSSPLSEPFGDITLDLPEGAQITSATVNGARMTLVVTLADGRTDVWVVDLSTGEVLGRIKAQP